MKAVILVVFVLTVAAVLCLLEAYREQQYFKVTEDGVVSRRLNGLKKEKKIVFLSDLHNKEYGVGNERLLDAICKARLASFLIGSPLYLYFKCSSSLLCWLFTNPCLFINYTFNCVKKQKEYVHSSNISGSRWDKMVSASFVALPKALRISSGSA